MRDENTQRTGYVKGREGGLMADRTLNPVHSLKVNSYPLELIEELSLDELQWRTPVPLTPADGMAVLTTGDPD